jgi:hypothetical protein
MTETMSEEEQAQLKAVGMEIRLKSSDDITAAFRSKDFDDYVPPAELHHYIVTKETAPAARK